MSTKKSDLKAELTDLLLSNEDSEKSISQILKDEPVTIGAPDQTALLKKKHERALEEKKKRESGRLPEPRSRSSREIPHTPLSGVGAGPSTPAVAQSRIEQLEQEVDSLRSENQKFDATTAALR